MWLLLQGWLLRNVLALLGSLAAVAAVAAVVQALTHMGVKFKGIDVLTDPGLREGIKQFTNWPIIPQLYVGGEFVGGCDIVREMYESGELAQLLEQKGVAYSG